MAEAKPEYLYSIRADNQKLKSAASEALGGKGVKALYDREVGAYKLVTEGLSEAEVKAVKAELAPFMSDAAKVEWQADREVGLSEKAALLAEVKARETTTREPKPVRAPVEQEDAFLMFPAHSQKDEFRTLVRETGSQSKFMMANATREAHYSVKTEVPERFAAFMGEAARERFVREHAELPVRGAKPQSINTAAEIARDEAQRRAASAFMVQYRERGFRLSEAARDPAGHVKQLNEMRAASTSQLIAVIKKSREIMMPLRDKELQLRAEAAGLSVDQLKAMSFADQKAVSERDGKHIGLVGDEFKINAQLSRGISAINAELNGRGVRQKTPEQSQDRGQAAENGAKQETPKGYTVDVGQSVDNDAELAMAFSRSRGRGR